MLLERGFERAVAPKPSVVMPVKKVVETHDSLGTLRGIKIHRSVVERRPRMNLPPKRTHLTSPTSDRPPSGRQGSARSMRILQKNLNLHRLGDFTMMHSLNCQKKGRIKNKFQASTG